MSEYKSGRIRELVKVIKDLERSPINSPFNPFLLRDIFVDKYKTRLKTLCRQNNK